MIANLSLMDKAIQRFGDPGAGDALVKSYFMPDYEASLMRHPWQTRSDGGLEFGKFLHIAKGADGEFYVLFQRSDNPQYLSFLQKRIADIDKLSDYLDQNPSCTWQQFMQQVDDKFAHPSTGKS
jgi:hypothetical protein